MVVPLDPVRLVGLQAVAKMEHKLVLESVARQRVDSHSPSSVEVGGTVFRQQHVLNLR